MDRRKESTITTANLFFERVIFDDFEISYSENDYFFGKYYNALFNEGVTEEVTEKEERAREDFEEIINSELGKNLSNISFEEVAMTTYNPETDVIELSPRVEAFLKFLKNSSVEEALFMNYLRADGLRFVYKHSGYKDLLNRSLNELEYKFVHAPNGDRMAHFKLSEEQWQGIAKVEFRKEILAWEVVFAILKNHKGYYFEGYDLIIDEEDLNKLKQYFLYRAACNLHIARLKKTICILNSLIFEY